MMSCEDFIFKCGRAVENFYSVRDLRLGSLALKAGVRMNLSEFFRKFKERLKGKKCYGTPPDSLV